MIVRLRFDASHRPKWLRDDLSCRVPLPPDVPPRRLAESHVVLWGDGADGKDGKSLPLAALTPGGPPSLAYDWASWRRFILAQLWAPPQRQPLYSRLPFHYHHIPGPVRMFFAGRMAPPRGDDDFPGYPIEQGFEALSALVDPRPPPAPARGRICLTHDIDTHHGFAFVRALAEREMERGFRSSFNIVGRHYPLDHALLDWLAENGFEIGLHGYNHDCKLAFLPEGKIRRRFDLCQDLIRRYHMSGFRSPSYLRSPALSRAVRDYFDYDLTHLDADWICVGGKGGCLTVRPFSVDGLAVIPTTLPVEFMISDSGMNVGFDYGYWDPKIDWLREVGGMAVVNTHADPDFSGNPQGIEAYGELLARLDRTFGGAWTLPRDLVTEARQAAA